MILNLISKKRSEGSARRPPWRQSRPWTAAAALLGGLVVLFLVALAVGPAQVSVVGAARAVADYLSPGKVNVERETWLVVSQIRLPRIVVGGIVGGALAVSGAVMQGVFRNPLAEPGIIGVSSGAAVGAVASLSFGWTAIGYWALPTAAFVGAAATLGLAYLIASVGPRRSVLTLLLAGIGLNAFAGALVSVLVLNAATEAELRSIMFWLQGSLEARTWDHAAIAFIPIVVGCVILVTFGRDLNLMALGDDHAATTGVNVAAVRRLLLIAASLVTGAAVAVSGVIAFVGLVVPHVLRLTIGADHRALLPASIVGGAIFVIGADTVARASPASINLTTGIIAALIGAPLLVALVTRSQKVVT